MAQQYDIQRKKRLQAISPFNGYQFRDHASLVITNPKTGKEMNIYQPKHEHPQFHNFLVNLRNSEAFLKNQDNFEDPYLEEVYNGKHKHQAGGFDNINEMIVNKSSLLPKIVEKSSTPKLKTSDYLIRPSSKKGQRSSSQPV